MRGIRGSLSRRRALAREPSRRRGGNRLSRILIPTAAVLRSAINRASSGVTEKVCVSVRPVIEGAGRAAGDLVHRGGDGRVIELAGAEEAEERVDQTGRGAVVRHARAGLVV